MENKTLVDKVLIPLVSFIVFGILVLTIEMLIATETRLSRTDPVPVEPMYYSDVDIVRAYPATANTHILREGGDTYVVFQMETEYRPVVLKSKLNGVCE